MMNSLKIYIINFVALIFLMIVQIEFSDLYSINKISPDLILIIHLRLSLQFPVPERSVVRGFIIGMITDLVIGDIIGISSLILSVTGFTASYYKRKKGYLDTKNKLKIYVVLILFSSLTYHFITFSGNPFFNTFFYYAIPTSIYTLSVIWILHILKPVK